MSRFRISYVYFDSVLSFLEFEYVSDKFFWHCTHVTLRFQNLPGSGRRLADFALYSY